MIIEPLGLRNIRYLPLNHFDKEKMVPTEHDSLFRKQLIHGHVHDGKAALAVLVVMQTVFSNATDLASIMQIFLKNGNYAGQILFDENIRKKTTENSAKKTEEGAGFDKPDQMEVGPVTFWRQKIASVTLVLQEHSLGQIQNTDIIFVFLSNRVV